MGGQGATVHRGDRRSQPTQKQGRGDERTGTGEGAVRNEQQTEEAPVMKALQRDQRSCPQQHTRKGAGGQGSQDPPRPGWQRSRGACVGIRPASAK